MTDLRAVLVEVKAAEEKATLSPCRHFERIHINAALLWLPVLREAVEAVLGITPPTWPAASAGTRRAADYSFGWVTAMDEVRSVITAKLTEPVEEPVP